MSGLPDGLRTALEAELRVSIESARPVAGGSIHRAARVVGSDRRPRFVKWSTQAPGDVFAVEQDGLSRLQATGAVRTPRVLARLEAPHPALVLEWVDEAQPTSTSEEDAGRQLARLHTAAGAAGPPGLDVDNLIGRLPQDNRQVSPPTSWVAFFRDRRLGPLAHHLPARLRRRLARLDLAALVGEPPGGCRLLHGDLWSGNRVADRSGRAWFVDPAVYRGHPSVDLAMTELFGGFSRRFHDAYAELAGPPEPGEAARRDVLNLYPLLVHVAMFGGGYVGRVRDTLAYYAPR